MRLWDYSILIPLLVRKAFRTASITGNKVAASSSLHSLISRHTRRTEGLSLCGSSSKSSLASILSARTTLNKVLSFGFPRPISILMMVRTSVSHLSATSSCVRPSSNRAFLTASAKCCEYFNIPIHLKDILQCTSFLFNSPQSIYKVYSDSCHR